MIIENIYEKMTWRDLISKSAAYNVKKRETLWITRKVFLEKRFHFYKGREYYYKQNLTWEKTKNIKTVINQVQWDRTAVRVFADSYINEPYAAHRGSYNLMENIQRQIQSIVRKDFVNYYAERMFVETNFTYHFTNTIVDHNQYLNIEKFWTGS